MKMIGSVLQFFLEFESTKTGHADIQDQAAGPMIFDALQKFVA